MVINIPVVSRELILLSVDRGRSAALPRIVRSVLHNDTENYAAMTEKRERLGARFRARPDTRLVCVAFKVRRSSNQLKGQRATLLEALTGFTTAAPRLKHDSDWDPGCY